MNTLRFWIISLGLLIASQATGQRIYVVNVGDDVDDGTCDAIHCSLREAINAANLDLLPSEIQFGIGVGQATILLTDALPRLTEEGTIIDGMTQNGMMGGLRIDCSGIGVQTQDILSIFADDTEIYGLEMFNYTVSENPMLEGAGSMIGVGGIFFPASPTDVIIGAPNRGNIIHSIQKTRITNANFGNGIGVHSGGDVVIQGNIIGTDLAGRTGLDIWNEGIRVDETQFGTTFVGGENPGEGNIIVASNRGVGLFGGEGWVKGNIIGRAPTGRNGNRSDGIILNLGDFYEIGGPTPAEGNVIEGNLGHGININTIVTAYVGYNICTDNGANRNGINVTSCPDCIVEHNTCEGQQNGIFVDDNGFSQVRIFRNSVGFNTDDGVQANFPPTARDIPISQNSHYCNGRGIGIGIKGPMSIFEMLRVNAFSTTGCSGVSSPNALIEIFYAIDPQCPDAFCQGVEYLGNTTADGAGNWTYNAILAPGIYTCTQTLPQNLTSPFAACFELTECITVVTNTNDAGPGSLREAILCANSKPGLDTISFNIPGPADHIIEPLSQLPDITGPTMIDATTQPSGRVIVDGSSAGAFTSGLIFLADTSSLFGIHMRDFVGANVLVGGPASYLTDVVIGAPGRGNYLYQSNICLHVYGAERTSIQSNILGTNDNYTPSINPSSYACQLEVNARSMGVVFGGSKLAGESNVVVNTSIAGLQLKSTEDSPTPKIFGNYFGTDPSETEVLPNCLARSPQHGALHLTSLGGVWIGDGTDDRANLFAFNLQEAIHVRFDQNLIRNNSFYCNEEAINLNTVGTQGNMNKPSPQITFANDLMIQGVAEAGDTVEVYLHGSDRCPDAPCQGRELIGRVRADAAGDWTLNAPFGAMLQSQDVITSLAYDDQRNTSEFSECVQICPDAVITAENDGPYCEGDMINLSGDISIMGTNVTFNWTGPNGYMSSMQNPSDATESGVYNLQVEVDGCRYPLVQTSVEIFSSDTTDIDTTLCRGDFIMVGNVRFDESRPNGEVGLLTSRDCDSLIRINLEFSDSFLDVLRDTLCPGEFVDFRGRRFDVDNPMGGDTLSNRFGCDSIYAIELLFNSTSDTTLDNQLCSGDSIIVNGVVYNEGNPAGMEVIQNQVGCDSIINISLSFGGARVERIDTAICEGDFILINGQRYDESRPTGSDTIFGGASVGCDSVVVVNLRFRPESVLTVDTVLCDGRFLEFNGIRYDQFYPAGVDTINGGNQFGCDSIIRVNIQFFEPEFVIDTVHPSCAGKSDGAIIIEEINGIIGPYTVTFNGIGPLQIDRLPFSIDNLDEGSYIVVVEDSRDCRHDFQVVLEEDGSLDASATSPISISGGQSANLTYNSTFIPDSTFWILNGDTLCVNCEDLNVQPSVNTTYDLWIYRSGCSILLQIEVIIDLDYSFYFPNSFTPDGNNINDWFNGFSASDGVVIQELQVFSRWGELVYHGQNLVPGMPEGWDGTFNGEELAPGVFVYTATIAFPDGYTETRLGGVTLIR